jgi:polysaccharide biosynthesis protein PslJ
MLASPSVVASLPGSALERSAPTGSARGRPRRRSSAWPLVALFLLLPVWWALGVSGVILSALFLPLLASLVLRRRLVTPRGFGLYLLFLLWCVFSATRLTDTRGAFALAYRGSLYLGAGALFVYVLNAPRSALSPDRAVRLMAGFFLLVVAGGLLGMVIADVHFVTPAEHLLPQRLLNDQFVTDLVSASTSSGRAFAAYPIFRPKAPFIYANEWGAAYAMSLPFGLCAIAYTKTRLGRDLLLATLIVSIFPLVFSLNRGAWLSAGAGLLYATIRLARGRNAQLLKLLAVGALVIGALFFVTPLGEIVMTRLSNGYGDAHREQLYRESIALVEASPILGYGAPVLVEGNLSAGTHGQLWTILVSQGVPGLLLFTGWLVWALWRASRPLDPLSAGDRNVRFWCAVAIFVAIVQMPYYDLLPWGLAIAMVAAALAWREAIAEPRQAAMAPGRRPVAGAVPS